MNERDFAGTVVIGTGGGGVMGRAVCTYLASEGADVVVNDADDERAAATVDAVVAAGGSASAHIGSVAEPGVAADLVASTMQRHGRIDVLVTAAGVSAAGAIDELDDDQLVAAVQNQLVGTLRITRAAIGQLAATGTGRVVHLTSSWGAFGWPGGSAAAAADGGIIAFSRSLAIEVAASGVRVNAVAALAERGVAESFFASKPMCDPSRYRADVIAAAVAALAHDRCDLVGEVLTAQAGRFARIVTTTAPGHFDLRADHREIERRWDWILTSEHGVAPRTAFDEMLMVEV